MQECLGELEVIESSKILAEIRMEARRSEEMIDLSEDLSKLSHKQKRKTVLF